MKLSQIISKYSLLNWEFNYTNHHTDNLWTFKSPRMKERRGFLENKFNNPNSDEYEINEENLIAYERECFVRQTYQKKINEKFDSIAEDLIRQMILVDERKVPIPEEFNISFDLNLK